MTRRIAQLTALALLVAATLTATADDKKKEPADIVTIMKEGHAGKNSLFNKIKAGVKAEEWSDAAEAAGKLREFGDDLGKNTPPKGSEESWTVLSKGYKQITTDIAKAVDKKDKTASDKALGALGKSCKVCHSQHKE